MFLQDAPGVIVKHLYLTAGVEESQPTAALAVAAQGPKVTPQGLDLAGDRLCCGAQLLEDGAGLRLQPPLRDGGPLCSIPHLTSRCWPKRSGQPGGRQASPLPQGHVSHTFSVTAKLNDRSIEQRPYLLVVAHDVPRTGTEVNGGSARNINLRALLATTT